MPNTSSSNPLDRHHIEALVRETLAKQKSTGPNAPAQTQGQTARAAVLEGKERLRLREFPLRPIRDDEILLRVEACGICGTDIHCYKNDPFDLCPVVLGHEGTGEVVEVGKKVQTDNVGKPVRVGDKLITSLFETSSACMVAKYNPLKANLCDDLKIYGLLPDEPDNHFNGYFGEYLIIRPGSSFFGVNDLSENLRVLIEPAAVVCHALDRARRSGATLNFRSRVIVQGCGPIGLMMVAALRTFGINNIIAIDGNDERLEWAAKLGADHGINYRRAGSTEAVAEEVRGLTKGIGAHYAFQVTGVPQAAANLLQYVRRGGGVCEVGHFVDAGEAPFNPHRDFCQKEITLTGSWAYNSWEYPNAYHFLERAEKIGLPVSGLITHRFPLSQIQEAFDTVLAQKGIKVVVQNDR